MMNFTKPNRIRAQDADRNEAQQKHSGDQHTLPIDEPPDDEQPMPHRATRQDMQKTLSESDRSSGNNAKEK